MEIITKFDYEKKTYGVAKDWKIFHITLSYPQRENPEPNEFIVQENMKQVWEMLFPVG